MPTTDALISAHLDRRRFDEAYAVALGAGRGSIEAEALALVGQRLVRLDLEDVRLLDRPDLWRVLPDDIRSLIGAVAFPGRASQSRRALGSFVPLYRAMLEAAEVRWVNGQTLHFLSIVHLIAEFAGHLAWEPVLGHPGDPVQLVEVVGRRGSRWGAVDDDECGHHRAQRRLANRVLDGTAVRSDGRWERFLREEFSRLGELLTVCATRSSGRVGGSSVRDCRATCAVWDAVPASQRDDQQHRSRLALLLSRSAIVQLRHSAPIGHFFGVPDDDEIRREWDDVKRQAARFDVVLDDGDLVTEMAQYCSMIAATPLRPATTIATLADRLSGAIGDPDGA